MIQFILEDKTIPKTVYWQTIYEILKKSKTQYDLYIALYLKLRKIESKDKAKIR
jgi:hypothetical protein